MSLFVSVIVTVSVTVTMTVPVTCLCWSSAHAEIFLFSCLCSKATYVKCQMSNAYVDPRDMPFLAITIELLV